MELLGILLTLIIQVTLVSSFMPAYNGNHDSPFTRLMKVKSVVTQLEVPAQDIRDKDNLAIERDCLAPNQLSKIRSIEGLEVGKFAYRLGLPENLTTELSDFLDKSGIDEMFRVLLTMNALEPGESLSVPSSTVDGENEDLVWIAQRPNNHWSNDMHWIASGNQNSKEKYLDILSRGGFNETLAAIGETFGMQKDEMMIHHAFFIGVSKASDSYTHQDFKDTDGRGFTLLIPLRLVRNKGPELAYQDSETNLYTWYKYVMNECALVGDGTWHKTANCDYTETNEYRICANIYICHKDHPLNGVSNTKGCI